MSEKYEKIFFENTRTKAIYNDSEDAIAFCIIPDEGYAIHNKFRDTAVIDEETGLETGEIRKGYTESYIIIQSDYNFEENPYDIYAVKKGDENNG